MEGMGSERELLKCMLKQVTLAYENKTPNEKNSCEINCADHDAKDRIFPFNASYVINLFFIEIGVMLRDNAVLRSILECFWDWKINAEQLTPDDVAFLVYSPKTEDQSRKDIRFRSIKEIVGLRNSLRTMYKSLYYCALDLILSMLEDPNDVKNVLKGLDIVAHKGIVFLISTELADELLKLLSDYPLGDNDKLHAHIISIKLSNDTIVENDHDPEENHGNYFMSSAIDNHSTDGIKNIIQAFITKNANSKDKADKTIQDLLGFYVNSAIDNHSTDGIKNIIQAFITKNISSKDKVDKMIQDLLDFLKEIQNEEILDRS